MDNGWILNSARTTGKSHISAGIPCQDSVVAKSKNGVTTIVLSDGCGSAPFSQYGSKITVEALSELLINKFDELYNAEENLIKATIVATIIKEVKSFIMSNQELLSDFKKERPEHYNDFLRKWPGYSHLEKVYPLTLFDATVQFVAAKGEKLLIGRLGDGVIGDVNNGALRIKSSEDKVGVQSNATWYPTTILITTDNVSPKYWDKFEIIKEENTSQYGMFFIVSDGVADVICGEDDAGKEKFLYLDEIHTLMKNIDSLTQVLEERYKPIRNVDDDLSIALMYKSNVDIDSIILREYDDDGRTISNDRIEKIDKEALEKAFDEELSNSENLLNVFDDMTLLKIKNYLSDDEYCKYFVDKASRIKQYLDENNQEKMEKLFNLVQPNVEEEDWILMLKQLSMLDIFTIDKGNNLIYKKEK